MAAKSRVGLVLLAAFGGLLAPRFSFAHHNHQVMTNYSYLLAVTGVVTEHEFINPHTAIHIKATDENGSTVEWVGYGSAPAAETRLGYSGHMFKLGEEKITMYGFPNKDGKNMMAIVKLVRANGEDIPIYQAYKADLDAFMQLHNVHTFNEIPETLKRYIGGPVYKANDDN